MADSGNQTAVDDEVTHLRAELAQLKEEFSKMIDSSSDVGRQSVRTLRAGVEHMKDYLARAKERGGEMYETVHEKVEERPVTYILVALGVGFILGKLLSSRR